MASNGTMNSLGKVSVPQMAASSNGNYAGLGGVPLLIDESSVAADNTMQQILNQSQLTAGADNNSAHLIGTGPSSVVGQY